MCRSWGCVQWVAPGPFLLTFSNISHCGALGPAHFGFGVSKWANPPELTLAGDNISTQWEEIQTNFRKKAFCSELRMYRLREILQGKGLMACSLWHILIRTQASRHLDSVMDQLW